MSEELERMAREDRRFTILQRERAMNEIERNRNISAIMAGVCILGTAATFYFSGQDVNQVVQHELAAIYSWEALGQYFKDLGPVATLLGSCSAAFIVSSFGNSIRLRRARQEFEDFNASLEKDNSNELGGDENAKSR